MAIGRNILGALGGLLNRGPDEDDPTLTPEERERRRRMMMANRMPLNRPSIMPTQTGGGLDQVADRMKEVAEGRRKGRYEEEMKQRASDALSQPTGELDMSKLLSTQKFDEPELPPEDAPVATEDSPGLLGRLGGMVKGNPELFAQIAQLGGGLISGMAQDKAQRRADATTQDRMARANLIGALTGRTPQVAQERADTGGFLSLDTLGKALQGGGAIATGELARRDAEAEQQRQTEMENARFEFDKKVDEENRALKRQGLDFDIEFTRAELALKEGRLALDEEGQKALNSWRERQAQMSDEDRANLKAYREQTIGVQQERNSQLKAQYDAQIERELEAKAGSQFKAVRDGIKDVNESTKLYQNGAFLDPTNGNLKLYNDIRSLFQNYQKDRNPANVTGIINTFQRMFDPATVREGDIALYREAEGQVKQLIQSAATVAGAGGSLSPFTIAEMKKVADDLHKLHVRKAKKDVDKYVKEAYEPEVREKLTNYYGELFTLPELPKTEAKDKDGSRRNRGDRRNTDNTKTGDSTTDDIDPKDLEGF